MSAAMHQQTDPTAGMRLVSTVNQNREAVRYLFTPGQFLDPDRVFQMEHLRDAGGGEEVQTHCFRRTVSGFLPRASLTPMEVWTDPLPNVLIGEGLEQETVHIQGPMTAEHMGLQARRPGILLGTPLSHVKCYPGEEIGTVLRANAGKGIVEVTALLGAPWYADEFETEPGMAQLLNRDFFPRPPAIALRTVEEAIDKAEHRSDLHRAVAKDMRVSCEQFRRWAEMRLAVEHGMLRERKSHQYTHSYSPVGRELLRQLEMQPQDAVFEQSTGRYEAMIAGIAERQGGLNPADIGAIVREVMLAMGGLPGTASEQPGGVDDEQPPPAPPQKEDKKAPKDKPEGK